MNMDNFVSLILRFRAMIEQKLVPYASALELLFGDTNIHWLNKLFAQLER
jgi:hypothetical protein